jgi:gliding motility-associated-like protein
VLTINFPQPLFATIASDTSLCFGEAVGLYPAVIQNGAQPYSYNWTYNAVNVTNSLNSTYTPQQTGTLCLAVTDACNSVVTACRNVEVEQPVLVKFSVDDSTGCWPTPMKLFVQTDTSLFAQSVWTISDGTSFINQDTVSTAFANPGTYDVTLTLISDIGCTYTTTKSQYLIQYQPPVASWSADPNPTNALETTVQFTNESIGDIVANSWLFDVENNTGLSAQVNPSYQYPLGVGGTYTVRLRVLDIHNCTDIVEGPVVINDIFQQFVPTALTPNNDGVNDVLKFVGTDIDETKFKFEVFNRWGDKVYESTDPSAAWIANASSGAYYVPDGVYIWKAVVVSKTTSERKELKGTITIVR